MSPPQKPKTPPPLASFPARPRRDAFQSGPAPGASASSPALSGVTTNVGRTNYTGVAPELHNRWHERAGAPRGVLPPEELMKAFDEAWKRALQSRATPELMGAQLKKDWLPLLRQVVERAGGDGLDAYVTQLLHPPGRQAETTLVAELARSFERMDTARELPSFEAAGLAVRAILEKTLANHSPRTVSLELQSRDLEGRVDVDVLLSIRFCSANELAERRARAHKTMEGMRRQMRSIPGSAPESLMSSLTSAKLEARVLDAEVRRRDGSGLP